MLEKSSGTVWVDCEVGDAGGGLSGVVITDMEPPDGGKIRQITVKLSVP